MKGILVSLFLLCLSATCAAQVQAQVHRGWGGKERNGRWNPLIVRASTQIPQNADLDWRWAVAGEFQSHIFEQSAIAPVPQTLEMIVPLHYSASSAVLVLTDPVTDKAIGQFPPHLRLTTAPSIEVGPQSIFIGISGMTTLLEDIQQSGIAETAYLPPRFLPRAAIGYDCLDVLFLNQPDLKAIDPEQQQAIVDWIAGGGALIVIPSDGIFAEDSPLGRALPCRIGSASSIGLLDDVVKNAGLRAMPPQISGIELQPKPETQSIEILPNSHIDAVVGRFGLGEILVAPVDLTLFRFDPTSLAKHAPVFWRPILTALGQTDRPDPKRAYEAPFYGYSSESEDQQREGAATTALCEFLSPPPAQTHGLPLVLFGILLIIGPIDSIVLYAMGRRHWTWTTVPGWLGLLLAGGYFATVTLRQSPPQFASATVIDQVDDRVIGQTQLIGFTSSSRREFNLPQADGWWQPAVPNAMIPGRVPTQSDLHFHQTTNGTTPESIMVDPGQSRFLRQDTLRAATPVIDASLKVVDGRIVGKIRNLSSMTLKEVRIRTRFGVVSVPLGADGLLPPQETVSVNLPAKGEAFSLEWISRRFQKVEYANSTRIANELNELKEGELWSVAPELGGRRSMRIDSLINKGADFACIYAQVANPSGIAITGNTKPQERYYEWLRAMVPLSGSANAP